MTAILLIAFFWFSISIVSFPPFLPSSINFFPWWCASSCFVVFVDQLQIFACGQHLKDKTIYCMLLATYHYKDSTTFLCFDVTICLFYALISVTQQLVFLFFFAALHSMWDLGSSSRDRTFTSYSGSAESPPLDFQGIPQLEF